MIRNCRSSDIEHQLFAHDPPAINHRDILYVPRSHRYPDPDFGLFTETGRQLLENATFEGFPSRIKCQRVATPLRRTPALPEIDHAIYGGIIAQHYGHFLTECLNTLWYSMHAGGDRIYLFHSPLTVEQVFAIPWMADLLTFAGIRPEQIVIPRVPTIIRRATVPGPAFCEDAFAYQIYGAFGRAIGEDAARRHPSARTTPAFLARSQLRGGTIYIENEPEIHEALERRGVEILYPEKMTVAEQIGVHRQRDAVSGFIGSAFHTSLFADGAKGCVLSIGEFVRRTFHLMDAVTRARFSYLAVTEFVDGSARAGFFRCLRLADPSSIADAVLRTFDGAGRTVPSAQARPEKQVTAELPTSPSPPVTLRSFADHQLVASRTTGRLRAVKRIDDDGEDIPVLLVRDGRRGLLAAATLDNLVLTLEGDEMLSPLLVYEILVGNRPGTIALRNPETGRLVSAPSEEFKRHAFNEVTQIGDWESFAWQRPQAPELADRVFRRLFGATEPVSGRNGLSEGRRTGGRVPLERVVARLASIDQQAAMPSAGAG